jgi:hypothetical protein
MVFCQVKPSLLLLLPRLLWLRRRLLMLLRRRRRYPRLDMHYYRLLQHM